MIIRNIQPILKRTLRDVINYHAPTVEEMEKDMFVVGFLIEDNDNTTIR